MRVRLNGNSLTLTASGPKDWEYIRALSNGLIGLASVEDGDVIIDRTREIFILKGWTPPAEEPRP